MSSERLLEGNYVVRGRISNYGTINILHKKVPEPKYHPWVGLVLYSETLLGKSHCQAKLTDGKLEVFHKEEVVTSLGEDDLFVVDNGLSGNYEVMGGGWLCKARTHQFTRMMGKDSIRKSRKMAAILRRVERGNNPPYYDGSPFVKVDPALRRRIMMILVIDPIDFSQRKEYRVINSKGEIVPCQVLSPLRRP